ncbi:skin secretory protein xP2-like [Columba livia]|uniref:skin secretory protein xP2-like n=1 Tax=Columba livia TaxID=8932 RepID=UPI0031BB95D9
MESPGTGPGPVALAAGVAALVRALALARVSTFVADGGHQLPGAIAAGGDAAVIRLGPVAAAEAPEEKTEEGAGAAAEPGGGGGAPGPERPPDTPSSPDPAPASSPCGSSSSAARARGRGAAPGRRGGVKRNGRGALPLPAREQQGALILPRSEALSSGWRPLSRPRMGASPAPRRPCAPRALGSSRARRAGCGSSAALRHPLPPGPAPLPAGARCCPPRRCCRIDYRQLFSAPATASPTGVTARCSSPAFGLYRHSGLGQEVPQPRPRHCRVTVTGAVTGAGWRELGASSPSLSRTLAPEGAVPPRTVLPRSGSSCSSCPANKRFSASSGPFPREGHLLPSAPATRDSSSGKQPHGGAKHRAASLNRSPAAKRAPCSREPPVPSQDAVLFTGAATTHERDTQTSQRLSCPYGMENVPKTQVPAWGGLGWPLGLPGGGYGPGRGYGTPPNPHYSPWTPNCGTSAAGEAQAASPCQPGRCALPRQQRGGPGWSPMSLGAWTPVPGARKGQLGMFRGPAPPAPKLCQKPLPSAVGREGGGVTSQLGPPDSLGCPGHCGDTPTSHHSTRL